MTFLCCLCVPGTLDICATVVYRRAGIYARFLLIAVVPNSMVGRERIGPRAKVSEDQKSQA